MAKLKDVIYLSNEDYETLISTGAVVIDGQTLTYNENNVYITPDKLASGTEDGLMSAADKVKLDGIEAGAEVNPSAYLKSASVTDKVLTIVPNTGSNITFDGKNQRVKVGNTTFDADAEINITGQTGVSVSGLASGDGAPKITITGTTYSVGTGDNNGQIKVTPSSGDAYNVSVKGLGDAAYKNTGTSSGNVPVLDSNGKLAESIIPAVAITDVHEAASEAAMLALTAQKGDICIRSDLNKAFVLQATPASTLENWKELLTPTDAVLSVQIAATSPVVSSTSTAQTGAVSTTISLANAYGDTKNPYGSKTKNYVLAAPSNAAGTPSFRALVKGDLPTLNASDVGITITTTAGSESISDGTNTLNVVTRDTEQTITSYKTIDTNDGPEFGYQTTTKAQLRFINTDANLDDYQALTGIYSGSGGIAYRISFEDNTGSYASISCLDIGTGGLTYDVGNYDQPVNVFKVNSSGLALHSSLTIDNGGVINPNTSNKGLAIPATTGWTANKTIATTDYVSANPGSTSATLSAVTINGTNYKIKGVDLTTTRGSEAISDGTNTINVVTRDTYQTINSVKTFTMSDDTPINIKYEGNENFAIALQPSYIDDTIIYRLGVEDNQTTSQYYNLYFPAKTGYLLAANKETIWETTTTDAEEGTETTTKLKNAKLDFNVDRWIISGEYEKTVTDTTTGETTTTTSNKEYNFTLNAPVYANRVYNSLDIATIEHLSYGTKTNIKHDSGILDISSHSEARGSSQKLSIWGGHFIKNTNGTDYNISLPSKDGTLLVNADINIANGVAGLDEYGDLDLNTNAVKAGRFMNSGSNLGMYFYENAALQLISTDRAIELSGYDTFDDYDVTITWPEYTSSRYTIALPAASGTIVVEDTPKIYNQLKVWPELPKNWGEQFIELHGKPNSTTSLKVTSKRTQELSKDDFLNNTFMKIPTSGTFYWAYHNKKTRGSDFTYDGLFRPHQSVGAPIADPDLTNLVMARKKYTNEINKTTLTYGDFIAELLGEDFANYIDSTQSIQFTRVASNGSASKNDSGGYKYYNALNKSDHLYISIPIQVNKVSEIIDCFQQSHICFNRKCQRSAANKSALINNFNAGTNSRICRGAALLDIVKCEVTAQPQYIQYIPKHVLAHLNVADIYFQRVYKYINYNNEVITVNRPQVIIRIDKKLFSEQYSD